MIKAILFTKNREMQCEAMLESFFFCTGFPQQNLTVLLANSNGYEKIIEKWPLVTYFDESLFGGFDKLLKSVVETIYDDDVVLPLVDDEIVTRPLNLTFIPDFLESHRDVLCVAARLGTNLLPQPKNISEDRRFLIWEWKKSESHFGWPVDLMFSAYRGDFFKKLVNLCPEEIKCPNFLESFGVKYCHSNPVESKMACLNTVNYICCTDVNRVQPYFENKVQSTQDLSAETLKRLYGEGKRLDWTKAWKTTDSDIFTGDKYWRLK